MKSDILLNLDSKDNGQIFIGCAGGTDATAKLWFTKELVPDHTIPFKVVVNGLKGSHSGDGINKGLGNANKILNRLILKAPQFYGVRMHNFIGGNLRNAIVREAEAVLLVNKSIQDQFLNLVEDHNSDVKNELKTTEPDMQVKAIKVEPP